MPYSFRGVMYPTEAAMVAAAEAQGMRREDIFDALQYSMREAGINEEQGSRLMRNATEVAQMQAEAAAIERRMFSRGRGLDVVVRIENEPMSRGVLVRTSVRTDLHHQAMIDPDQINTDDVLFEMARNISREFVSMFEAEVTRQLMTARSRMREDRYRRNDAYDYARHAADMMTGFFGSSEAAKIDGPITWLADFPHKTFEHDGWTAHALDTADMIRAEGENMSHCLGKSYITRINKAEYIAYHITAPEGQGYPKSGFTLGFHKRDHGFEYDQLKGKKNSTHYNTDAKLLAIVDKIRVALCGDTSKVKNGDRVNVRIDLRAGAVNIVNRASGALNTA